MPSALHDSGSTRRWRNLRAAHALTLPRPCWRCGATIQPTDVWDLGHVVDRVDGGNDDHLAPEHRRCSREAAAHSQAYRARARRVAAQAIRYAETPWRAPDPTADAETDANANANAKTVAVQRVPPPENPWAAWRYETPGRFFYTRQRLRTECVPGSLSPIQALPPSRAW